MKDRSQKPYLNKQKCLMKKQQNFKKPLSSRTGVNTTRKS